MNREIAKKKMKDPLCVPCFFDYIFLGDRECETKKKKR